MCTCFHRQGYFNSQPHEEADDEWKRYIDDWWDFNSQPHEEADVKAGYSPKYARGFQLAASRGG